MGQLVRSTRIELEACEQEDGFWDELFGWIASGGSLKKLCDDRKWAFGPVWNRIKEDENLAAKYQTALEGRAEFVHEECIPIADASQDAKLMVQERRKSAAVWNKSKYGEGMQAIGLNLDPLSELLKEISERRLARMKTINQNPEPAIVVTSEEAQSGI